MGGALVGRAQLMSLAGQQRPGRERRRHVLTAAEAGERRVAEVHARWAAKAGKRRVVEARARWDPGRGERRRHMLTGSKGQGRRRVKRGIKQ